MAAQLAGPPHLKENPAAGPAASAAKAGGGPAPAPPSCEAPPAAAAAARRAALGQLGLNRLAPTGGGRRADGCPAGDAAPPRSEPAPTLGAHGAEHLGDTSPADDVDDGEIEAYHPNPHAALDGDAALLAAIAAAEATLAPASGASDAERAAAEAALWERFDLPWIDAEALGRAHAVSRVCAFLDAFGGGAPPE